MHFKNLSLVGFKNYSELNIDLHPKLNCFVGNNGVGKTNLLDSIYYLCMCKSYFQATDQFTIRNNEEFMVLQAKVSNNDKTEEIYCGLKRGKKKQFRRNKKEYGKLSEHIGLLPVVMVSPNDIQLITEGSEERRKYINSVISQFDKLYLEGVQNYNRILAQRNKLLKDMRDQHTSNDVLDILDAQLVEAGNEIYEKRKNFVETFIPVFNEYYQAISGGNEQVELIYHSQLNEADFKSLLAQCRAKDKAVQFSTVGIHKDDLVLNLSGNSIKKIGSQGQQKTYLVALKFAQFEFLRRVKNMAPIVLLDDVFDKLDSHRVKNLLHVVSDDSFGQIFITHTNPERMQVILRELNLDHRLFQVQEGTVAEQNVNSE